MERLALALGLIVVAVAVAAVVRARGAPPRRLPTKASGGTPTALDRADFTRPDAPWLVVAFSSETCLSCQDTWAKVALLESAEVAVEDVPFQTERALHEQYEIDSVPLVLVADAHGAVRATFLGPPSAADLWSALADLRDDDSRQ